jgi:protein SCO1/2
MRLAMRGAAVLFAIVFAASPSAVPRAAAQQPKQYPASGVVVTVAPDRGQFVASIQEIPGLMRAMAMPFDAADPRELDGLAPGVAVEFVLVVDGQSARARGIHIVKYQSVEQDPLAASRLKLLNEIANGAPAVKPLTLGQAVPDFTLVDQRRRPVTLSRFRGSVVAINFIYTSCALPNFCLRIANHFDVLQNRFKARLGQDLVLLTVTFDPVHDTPEVLAEYAKRFSADAATWHFLTGAAAEVQRVCRLFGVDFFPDEGLMNHSLHTALIDRSGKLVANLEGNQFSADQLGDLAQSVLGPVR